MHHAGLPRLYYEGVVRSTAGAARKKENERLLGLRRRPAKPLLKWTSGAMVTGVKVTLINASVRAEEMRKLHLARRPIAPATKGGKRHREPASAVRMAAPVEETLGPTSARCSRFWVSIRYPLHSRWPVLPRRGLIPLGHGTRMLPTSPHSPKSVWRLDGPNVPTMGFMFTTRIDPCEALQRLTVGRSLFCTPETLERGTP